MKGRGRPSASRSNNPLYQAREKANISAAKLAREVGCDVSYIHKIERGEVGLKQELANRIESTLGFAILDIPSSISHHDVPLAEKMIRLIRSPKQISAIPENRFTDETLNSWSGTDENLQEYVEEFIYKEMKEVSPRLIFLWTGKNYQFYSNFYNDLYSSYIIPGCQSAANVKHLIRDGSSDLEKLETIIFCTEQVLKIRNNFNYRIKVVSNMGSQSYTNDLYWGGNLNASLICWTGVSAGEPSICVYTNRRQDLIGKYLHLVESNSEEKVMYFPQNQRDKFFGKYLTTEGRAGDWSMVQRLPASATRPMADFTTGTEWANRAAEIEKSFGNKVSIDNLIETRRTSAEFFLDRISENYFRQIISRPALERWINDGTREDLEGFVNYKKETVSERRSRIKNLIELMENSNGRFQMALTTDDKLESLGFSNKNSDNVSWVVQGMQATTFEAVETDNDGKQTQMNVIVRNTEFNTRMQQNFDHTWKHLPNEETKQNNVKSFLLDKLRDIK